MTLQIAKIVQSISGIRVQGVRMFGMDNLPTSLTVSDTPCLLPEPVDFVTGLVLQRDSFGTASQAKKTVQYVLSWRFLYMPIGAERMGLERYGDMVEKAFAVLDALVTLDATAQAVELEPVELLEFGVVADPSNNHFSGCMLRVRVTEFIN